MGVLKYNDKKELTALFSDLSGEVTLMTFTQETECDYCRVTREMVEELATLSDRIHVDVLDFQKDRDKADALGVDKIPAIAVMGSKDFGIRFYGIPAGYEFNTLIEAILDVSRGTSELPEDLLHALAKVNKPIRIQVMVSPTCPYCTVAVRAAHQLAMASDHITGDMVEISEFPHLAVKYNVSGVPNTIVNETQTLVGPQPDSKVVEAVLRAAEQH